MSNFTQPFSQRASSLCCWLLVWSVKCEMMMMWLVVETERSGPQSLSSRISLEAMMIKFFSFRGENLRTSLSPVPETHYYIQRKERKRQKKEWNREGVPSLRASWFYRHSTIFFIIFASNDESRGRTKKAISRWWTVFVLCVIWWLVCGYENFHFREPLSASTAYFYTH
jgi:hypothetical protein